MSMQRLAVPALVGTSALGALVYYRSGSKNESPSSNQQPGRHPAAAKLKEGLGGAGVGGNATSGGHDAGVSHKNPGSDPMKKVDSSASPDKLPAGGVGGGVGGGGANVRSSVEMTQQKHPGEYAKGSPSKEDQQGRGQKNSGDHNSSHKDPSPEQRKDALAGRTGDRLEGNATKVGDTTFHSKSYPKQSEHDDAQKDAARANLAQNTGGSSASEKLHGWFGSGGSKAAAPGENRKRYDDPRVHSHDGEAPTKRNFEITADKKTE